MIEISGTWDIETEDWSTFVAGAIYTPEDGIAHTFDENKFVNRLCDLPPGTYWAHNAGRFDSVWLVAQLIKRRIKWRGRMRGSGLLEVRVGRVIFRDSFALWPERLKTIAPARTPKLDLELPCRCEPPQCTDPTRCDCSREWKGCGGYCSIKRDMPPHERAIMVEYLHRDCTSLYEGLTDLVTYAARVGITLAGTVGATAWATCADWLGMDTKEPAHDLETYHKLRAGYYGGRTEVFRLLADYGVRFDINSSYPAALFNCRLPVGQWIASNPRRAYNGGRDGVFSAIVDIPECHAPPLPVRVDGRLHYQYGQVTGTWTARELRYAESLGAKVIIQDGIYTNKSDYAMRPFAERIWAIRDAAKKSEHDGIYREVKWIANSLTGKLAMKSTVSHLHVNDRDEGMYEGADLIYDGHGTIVYTTESERVSSCAHVQYAAELTAYARIALNRRLVDVGEDAIYCDTDSVYSLSEIDPKVVGSGLGQWKREGELKSWECAAPKTYRYLDEEDKPHARGKGMPHLTYCALGRLLNGGTHSDRRGVLSFRQAARNAMKDGGSIFRKQKLDRSLNLEGDLIGSRRKVGDRTVAIRAAM